MLEKLLEIEKRFQNIDERINDPDVLSNPSELQRLGKTRSELEPIVAAIREYKKATDDLCQAEELLNDPEMRELAASEIEPLRAKVASLEDRRLEAVGREVLRRDEAARSAADDGDLSCHEPLARREDTLRSGDCSRASGKTRR